jgi:site-specific recombinase XerD
LIPSSRHTGKYSLRLVRKGGVEASIPLLDETVQAYRQHLAQYEMNSGVRGDSPLVLPLRDADLKPPIASVRRNHIWRIVKDLMISAADCALVCDDKMAETRLREASTHWLRHTFANDLLDNGADLRSVRDLMDHASISTTNQYLHRPEDRLREDLEKLIMR